MPYKDPQKQKEAQHQHYLDNKDKYLSAHQRYKKRMRDWLNKIKEDAGCLKCGEKRLPCLEFHHPNVRNGDIEKRISYLIRSWGKKRILEEIEKCQILCKNCHAVEHWDEEEKNFYRLH